MERERLTLYAVTDRSWLGDASLTEQIEEALQGGVSCIQLREKHLPFEEFLEEAKEVKKVCQQYGVPFLINDNVELALKVDADGVHIGQDDMDPVKVRALLGPNKIMGVSAHNVEEAMKAQSAGADYLGVGAVFGTATKKDANPLPKGMLHDICHSVTIPIVAIGGVNRENIKELAGSGVAGVAVVSAVFAAENIREESGLLYEEVCRMKAMRKTALTIAGSDSSGGAGIQADLKTMLANGVYGMSAITALTAQNTTGVSGIFEVTPEFVAKQLDAVFQDIRPDAVKIGMLSSAEIMRTVSAKLKEYRAEHIVVDPVMVSTSGCSLMQSDATIALQETLFKIAEVVTPNIPEAEVLAQMTIKTSEDMERAAAKIGEEWHCAVLCKGGHSIHDADDLLYRDGTFTWIRGKRIENPNTHGTGCTLSSAIASHLALGYDLERAIEKAKAYISGALEAGLDLGKGSGPLDHGYKTK